MTTTIEPSVRDLALWWTNLDPVERGRLVEDYTTHYGGTSDSFPDLAWLKENHGENYEDLLLFVENGDGDLVDRYRNRSVKLSAPGRLEIPEIPRVRLSDDPDRLGAWVEAWVFLPDTPQYKVTVWPDETDEDPSEWGGWKLYSFHTRYGNFRHPDTFDMKGKKFQADMKAGLVHPVGCYIHGSQSWFLPGEGGPGSNCEFDGSPFGGLLVWEDSDGMPWPEDTPEADRMEVARKSARGFLETYCAWVNGEVQGYTLEEEGGDSFSCGGFYTADSLVEDVFQQADGAEVDWGDADFYASIYDDLKRKEEA